MTGLRASSRAPLHVLVAGGGPAAVEAVLALRALAGERVTIELLAPGGDLVHRPSAVVTPFTGLPVPEIALDRLAELGVTRRPGALAAVSPERRQVRTTGGAVLAYDRLIVATGARAIEGVPGATTFRGPISAGAVERALRGARERVIFTLPAGSAWTLPLYELALQAARDLAGGPELAIVTPEPRPLALFGQVASDAVARLLHRAGVAFEGDTVAEAALDGLLLVRDRPPLAADAVIALPRLQGPRIGGLPADADGFVPIDEHARVTDAPGVFAAGDVTAGPVKQGGLATQQADAAAEKIAAEAGALVRPRPYRPVLRGLLLTGDAPLYVRTELEAGAPVARPLRDARPAVSRSQLWWPSDKIAGRYLSGWLAAGGRGGAPLRDRDTQLPPVEEQAAADRLPAALDAEESLAGGDAALRP